MACPQKCKEVSYHIKAPGISLYCRVLGSGPPIVLLHGYSQSNQLYKTIETRLANQYTLLLLDSRGHGKSSLGKQAVTTRLMAGDVVRVLDHLGFRRCSVIGFSDGANIALQLAVDFPNRVGAVVAISPNARPDGLKPYAMAFIKFWQGILKVGAFFKFPYAVRQDQLIPLLLEQPNLSKKDLKSITTPTLLLWARNDLMTHNHMREISRNIACSKTIIIQNSNHLSIIRKWPAYEKRILHFLEHARRYS